MSESLADITLAVVAGFPYRLTLAVQVQGPTDKHPALVRFVFMDASGAPIAGDADADPAPFLKSDIFGDYRYIGKPAKAGLVEADIVFTIPEGCTHVMLELHRWRAETVRVKQAMKLAPADAAAAEALADLQTSDKLIATSTHEVASGESYDVLFAFSGSVPLEERGILVAVRFSDAAGARLDPPANLPVSDLAGAFRYVTPTAGMMLGTAGITTPAGAAQMQLRVLRWKQDADWHLDDIRLVWLGSDAVVVARGMLDLPTREDAAPDAALAISARVSAAGGSGTLLGALHLTFEDASGVPVMIQGDNMSRSDRFMNHVPVRPPSAHMMAADGSFPIGRSFVPPPGAVRMGWRLLDPEGGWRLGMQAAPVLKPFAPDPAGQLAALPQAARWCATEVSAQARALLQAALPLSALWDAIALEQVHLLGEALCPVTGGEWYALSGMLDALPAQLLICPQYFDADNRLLPDVVGPGCTRSGNLPPGRDVALNQADTS